jgi:alkylation response protein AidB-like acyl-CoA dehydrogenase
LQKVIKGTIDSLPTVQQNLGKMESLLLSARHFLWSTARGYQFSRLLAPTILIAKSTISIPWFITTTLLAEVSFHIFLWSTARGYQSYTEDAQIWNETSASKVVVMNQGIAISSIGGLCNPARISL